MLLFKKLKFANKAFKAYAEVKAYNDKYHLTDDTKTDLKIIKEAAERIKNRVPAYVGLYELVKDIL